MLAHPRGRPAARSYRPLSDRGTPRPILLAAARAKAPDAEDGRVTIELPISQSELALLIGASRPKVNTALSMLESSGALERNGPRIVCDLEELQAIAGAE